MSRVVAHKRYDVWAVVRKGRKFERIPDDPCWGQLADAITFARTALVEWAGGGNLDCPGVIVRGNTFEVVRKDLPPGNVGYSTPYNDLISQPEVWKRFFRPRGLLERLADPTEEDLRVEPVQYTLTTSPDAFEAVVKEAGLSHLTWWKEEAPTAPPGQLKVLWNFLLRRE